jgi:hypothetical protein
MRRRCSPRSKSSRCCASAQAGGGGVEERFEKLFQPENLEVISLNGKERESVRCNHYGILHHHDFTRDENGQVDLDIASQMPRVVEKSRFIVNRFLQTFTGKRVLFVRNSLVGDLWYADSGRPFCVPSVKEQVKRATKLHTLLRSLLTPRHLDIVVISNLEPGTTLSLEGGGVVFEMLGERISEDGFWDENYDLMFDRLGIRGIHSET